MKPLYKKGLTVLFILVSIGFISLLCINYYLNHAWEQCYTKGEMKAIAAKINEAPKLNDNFYRIYDKLYIDRHAPMFYVYANAFYADVFNRKRQYQTCWFVEAAPWSVSNHTNHIHFKVAWGLQQFTISEKCFNYIMNEQYESLRCNIHGIDTTIKKLEELQGNDEILAFLILKDHPSYYQHHPYELYLHIGHLRQRLSMQD